MRLSHLDFPVPDAPERIPHQITTLRVTPWEAAQECVSWYTGRLLPDSQRWLVFFSDLRPCYYHVPPRSLQEPRSHLLYRAEHSQSEAALRRIGGNFPLFQRGWQLSL